MKETKKTETKKENVRVEYLPPDYDEAIGFAVGFLFGVGKL